MTVRQKFAIDVAIAPQSFVSLVGVRRMAGGGNSAHRRGGFCALSRPSLVFKNITFLNTDSSPHTVMIVKFPQRSCVLLFYSWLRPGKPQGTRAFTRAAKPAEIPSTRTSKTSGRPYPAQGGSARRAASRAPRVIAANLFARRVGFCLIRREGRNHAACLLEASAARTEPEIASLMR